MKQIYHSFYQFSFRGLLLLSAIGMSIKLKAQDEHLMPNLDKQFFIENKGQWDDQVLFLSQNKGMNLWITKNGVTYDLYNKKTDPIAEKPDLINGKDFSRKQSIFGQVIKVGIESDNTKVQAIGQVKQSGYYNYLLGNDQSKWADRVGLYKEAIVKNVLTNIDARYYFEDQSIRYDYIVHPTGKVDDIVFSIEGSEKVNINEVGELVINTRFGELRQAKLFSYQTIDGIKKEVKSQFIQLSDNNFGFKIDEYDKTKPLIIDPLLYSTFLGGSIHEQGVTLALDGNNKVYVAGGTWSTNFPTVVGSYDEVFNGWADGFVSKLDMSLSGTASLVYSTFIGDGNHEWFYSIDVDPLFGNAYVIGQSKSGNYPTVNAYQPTLNGIQDAVVSVLTSDGTGLLYSSFLGGSDNENGYGIKIDPTITNNLKRFYVVGYTGSSNFPTSVGAFDQTFNGAGDVFISKIDPNLATSGLLSSTYLGGADAEWGTSLTLDASINVYATGTTRSVGFPGSTLGTYYSGKNVFVTKLNPNLSAFNYSIQFGGDMDDIGNSIVLNSTNEAYILGNTGSTNFPITTGSGIAGGQDMFVSNINAAGNFIANSRFLGGSNYEEGSCIKIFNTELYLTGFSNSANYPTTQCAYDEIYNGTGDVVFTKLNSNLVNVVYSTFIGSTFIGTTPGLSASLQGGQSLALDPAGIVYIAGLTQSSNFPSTANAFDQTFNSGQDAFALKLDIINYGDPCNNAAPSLAANINFTPAPSSLGYKVTSNITINGNVVFNSLNIGVGGPFSITVNSGSLTIDNSHLHGCLGLWEGIKVKNGAKLYIKGNALIEDAKIAVEVLTPFPNTVLDINTAIFNKNVIGVSIQDFNSTSTTYPFTIKNTVFTSRNLTSSCTLWPNWYTVAQLKTTTVPAHDLISPYSMANCSFMALKNGTIRPYRHIELINVGQTLGTGFNPIYYEQYIGGNASTEMNLFDNADVGINAINSNFATVNAVFQNISKRQNSKDDGVAVRARKNMALAKQNTPSLFRIRCVPSTPNGLKNKFYDCFKGIESTDYYNHELNRNEFRSTQSTANLTTVLGNQVNNNTVGSKAIDVISIQYHTININDNYIANHAVGIFQVSGSAFYNPLLVPNSIRLSYRNIDRNVIENKSALNPLTSTFLGDAIAVFLINGTGNSYQIGGQSTSFSNFINENIIRNAYRGIHYWGFTFPFLTSNINSNIINLSQDFYPTNWQTSIHTLLNLQLNLSYNTATGIGNTAAHNLFCNYFSGLNTIQKIYCNLSKNTYAGFTFLATNTGTNWTVNKMDKGHFWGYYLAQNGVIGNQGTALDASDNQWNGIYTNAHTNVDATSDASFSKLFVRGAVLPFKPSINAGLPFFSYANPTNLPAASLPIGPKSCGILPSLFVSPDSMTISMMESIIQDDIAYQSYVDQNRWMAKQNVYRVLKYDHNYTNATPILTNFFNNPNPSGIFRIQEIEDNIDEGNYQHALNLNNALSPVNNIEDNYKTYYNLFLNYMQTGDFDDADVTSLLELAHKCIYIDGPSVASARIFYNTMFRDQFRIFNEECAIEEHVDDLGDLGRTKSQTSSVTSKMQVSIFPNPTKNGFRIESNCEENCLFEVSVQSITGQILLQRKCNLNDDGCFIETHLPLGTYTVFIKSLHSNYQEVKKLVISQ